MGIHLITGYAGAEHITSADAGSLNAAIMGGGQYVLEIGKQFAASAVSNNIVRVLDGDLLMQGRHIRLEHNTYEDLPIENGLQSVNRNDLIVARYERNSANGKESVKFIVIKGTESSGAASDPAFTQGNILAGDLVNDMPLYRVSLSGISISAITPLFAKSKNLFGAAAASHTHIPIEVGLGNVPNVATNDQKPTYTEAGALGELASGESLTTAFGKLKKAVKDLIAHIANKANPHGVTAAQAGAVPTSRTVNGKALSANITLAASDVGAVGVSDIKTGATTTPKRRYLRLPNNILIMWGTTSVSGAVTDLLFAYNYANTDYFAALSPIGATATVSAHIITKYTNMISVRIGDGNGDRNGVDWLTIGIEA